jgi:peptide/nickel transport system substrate-binding protein
MLFYENESAMMEDLENGDLDLARFCPTGFSSVRDSIDNNASGIIQYYHGQTCSQRSKMLDIDMRNGIGGNPARLDPAVRQAILMAVNKTEIVSDPDIYGGFADEGTTLMPSVNSRWHYEPPEDDRIQHDFQAANDLLEENGYRYTPDSPDVRVATADSWAVQEEFVPEDYPLQFELVIFRQPVEDAPIAKHFVDACKEIGIAIEYSVASYALTATLCPVFEYFEMTLWSWTSDIDPVYQLFRQSSRSIYGWNDNYYNNSAYDENFTNSVMELNESKRQQYVYNCQKIHYEDSAYISLAYVHDVFAWRTDRFQGWTNCSSELGASLANTWGANPLLFALEPVGEDEGNEQLIIISVCIAAIVAVVALAMFHLKRRRAPPE